MNAIVYSSRTLNTESLAKVIEENSKEVSYFGKPGEEALKAKRLFVGFWTDKGTANEEILAFLKTLKEKEIFLFGTCGFGVSDEYFQSVLTRVKSVIDESNTIIGSFMCQGRMPMAVKERYLSLQKADKKIPNLDLLIENFDKALEHPNSLDYEKLKEIIIKL